MNLDDEERLFLVQLPAILPISLASRAAAQAAAKTANGAAAAAVDGATTSLAGSSVPPSADAAEAGRKAGTSTSSEAHAGGGQSSSEHQGCSLKELPSGSIGRLLVYKSGKVKLLMGQVTMDVAPGLPCQHRMDVRPPSSTKSTELFD